MPQQLPDLGAGIKLYIADCIALGASGYNAQILLELPNDPQGLIVPSFKNVILISVGRGGQGYLGSGLQSERVDIQCYGKNRKTAHDIWKTLDYYFLDPSERIASGFTRANVRVKLITFVTALRLTDQRLNWWPFTNATYEFTYDRTPV